MLSYLVQKLTLPDMPLFCLHEQIKITIKHFLAF